MNPGTRVDLAESQRTALTDYCVRELDDAMSPHAEKEQRLAEWDRLYMAEPQQARKSWPWDGAANLVIPLIGTTVDSILARLVNTIFGVDPFWTVTPLHQDFAEYAKPTENFLEWSRHTEFDLYKPVKRWTNEVIKYGDGWLKPVWEIQTRPYYSPLEKTPQDMTFRRPNVYHVLAQDVVCQAGIEDETQAEWIAHRFRLTDGQVRWRFHDEVFAGDVEDILAQKADRHSEHDLLGDGQMGARTSEKLNTFYEMQMDYPLNVQTKLPVSIVVTIHRESRTIVRCIHNPSFYGERALMKGSFVEYEGRAQSIGICRMLASMQAEMSTVHNQQVDNATLANTRFFLGRRGAVKPNTRIWPGRFLTVSDVERDVKIMQLGDIYPSMRGLEQSIMAFAERRSGVTDYQLGREATVGSSRATATGTLALIQEGNRRFDLNVRDLRAALGDVGKRVLLLNQQFRPRGMAYFVQGEDGAMTEATLDLPQEYLAHRLGVQLTASTATINREVEKQGLLAVMQLLQQHMQQGQSAAMLMANPQVPGEVKEYTAKAFKGMQLVMERTLHAFNQKDTDAIVPTAMLEAQYAPEIGSGIPGDPGSSDGGGPPVAPGGVAGQPDLEQIPGVVG